MSRRISLAEVARGRFPDISPAGIAAYRAAGWTGNALAAVWDLAEWATEHRTGVFECADGLSPSQEPGPVVEEILCSIWTRLVGRRIPERLLLAWVGVLAAAPDLTGFYAVHAVLIDPPGWTHPEFGACQETCPHPFHRWEPLGPIGAVAFAAGLSPAEAQTRLRQVERTAPLLREWLTLAALRGWQLPGAVLSAARRRG